MSRPTDLPLLRSVKVIKCQFCAITLRLETVSAIAGWSSPSRECRQLLLVTLLSPVATALTITGIILRERLNAGLAVGTHLTLVISIMHA